MNKTLLALIILLNSVPAFSQSVKINDSDRKANEPTIAISRTDPNIIVAASNNDWIYYSHDKGLNWTSYHLESSLGFYGDPVLLAGPDGQFYLVHLSKTPGKKWGDWFDRIVFQKSVDGGKTFTDGVGIGYNQDRTQDKPWINIDKKGQLYLTWTEFDKYGSDSAHHKSKIMFSMSADEGNTWSNPLVISDKFGGCVDDDNTLEGATTAIGPNGTVYVVWAGAEELLFDKSMDGGKTFGKDRVIAQQKGGWVLDIPHLYRTNGMPFLQADSSGNLFLVFTTKINDENKVVLLRSRDGGESWNEYYKCNEPGDQFFPNLAVDSESGTVLLGFYHSKSKWRGHFAQFRHIYISEQGVLEQVSMVPRPFALPDANVFFGDYTDVDIHDGKGLSIFASYSAGDLERRGWMSINVYPIDTGSEEYIWPEWTEIQRADSLYFLIPNRHSIKVKVRTKGKLFPYIYHNHNFDNLNADEQEWKLGVIALEPNREFKLKIVFKNRWERAKSIFKLRYGTKVKE